MVATLPPPAVVGGLAVAHGEAEVGGVFDELEVDFVGQVVEACAAEGVDAVVREGVVPERHHGSGEGRGVVVGGFGGFADGFDGQFALGFLLLGLVGGGGLPCSLRDRALGCLPRGLEAGVDEGVVVGDLGRKRKLEGGK